MLGWSKIEDCMKDLGKTLGEHTDPETDKIVTVTIGIEVEKRPDDDEKTFFITYSSSDERSWFNKAFFVQLADLAHIEVVPIEDGEEDD